MFNELDIISLLVLVIHCELYKPLHFDIINTKKC